MNIFLLSYYPSASDYICPLAKEQIILHLYDSPYSPCHKGVAIFVFFALELLVMSRSIRQTPPCMRDSRNSFYV